MNALTKLINQFTSTFFNNSALKHSTLGSLKLFFERNNKFAPNLASLGNVFRNSK